VHVAPIILSSIRSLAAAAAAAAAPAVASVMRQDGNVSLLERERGERSRDSARCLVTELGLSRFISCAAGYLDSITCITVAAADGVVVPLPVRDAVITLPSPLTHQDTASRCL